MQSNIITSDGDGQIRSPSIPAEHQAILPVSTEPPADGQSTKVYRKFPGLMTRPYCSMPNIMVMYGANGQTEKVYSEFSGLTTRQYFSMPNIAVMYGAGDAIETQSPSSVSTRPVVSVGPAVASGDLIGPSKKLCSSMPNIHVTFGATEATGLKRIPAQASVEVKNGQITKPVDVYTSLDSVMYAAGDAIETQSPSSVVSVGPAVASNDLIGPPKKLCSSMPNIHVTFGATEATGFKRIPAQASVEVKNGQITKPVDVYASLDSIASSEGGIEFMVPTTQRRRRTWWKRTKKFARRLFCCA